MEGEKTTLIDADANLEGKLTGKDAQIMGRFRGEIELSGRLQLSEGSRVEARVIADAAEIGGEFKGDLVVRSLLLFEKAKTEGTLDAQTLVVREGAQINGAVNASGSSRGKPGAVPKQAGAISG